MPEQIIVTPVLTPTSMSSGLVASNKGAREPWTMTSDELTALRQAQLADESED